MADSQFTDERLVELYDPLEDGRPDLDVYAAMVDEFGARSVLDVGCGTGTFACLLAARGLTVVGVDPAAASVALARRKAGAGGVRWIDGYATDLPPLQLDLAVMTGNVAQVFVSDADWLNTLRAVHAALRPGGRLVFETRRPEARAWRDWTPDKSRRRVDVLGVGPVENWTELLAADDALVTFRSNYVFPSGEQLTSESTLRFRTHEEVMRSLSDSGYVVDEVREAPDRPGREMVFVAARPVHAPV